MGQQRAPSEGPGLAAAQAQGARRGCGVPQLLGQTDGDICLQGDCMSALPMAPCEGFLGHKPERCHLTGDLSSLKSRTRAMEGINWRYGPGSSQEAN